MATEKVQAVQSGFITTYKAGDGTTMVQDNRTMKDFYRSLFGIHYDDGTLSYPSPFPPLEDGTYVRA